jgi:chemotaxis protein methyltransferase CheR
VKHGKAPPPVELAALVEEHLGFSPESPGSGAWARIVAERVDATGAGSLEGYRRRLAAAETRREEVSELARSMTVGETYFFRDGRQFEALTTVILPEVLRRRPSGDIRILSVACSTGEEPYSIAIAARELLRRGADRIRIHAFDVNPSAIGAAERAVYSDWALRATPASLRDRWFAKRGGKYVLAEEAREAVELEVRNLFDDDEAFWAPGRFDVIFCRNALIYFSHRKIAMTLGRLTDALAPGGTLFLGHAETPRGFEDRLGPRELSGTFVYATRDPSARERMADGALPADGVAAPPAEVSSSEATRPAPGRMRPSGDPTPIDGGGGDAWVHAIEAAARRLESIVLCEAATRPTPEPARGPDRATLLSDARRLVLEERFGEALERLDALSESGRIEGEIALLRASILTNQGRFVEAIDACRRVLVDAPHAAGAYHLLGVAAEQLGRLDEARRHHETAITLQPAFAMSHWRLGRLSVRSLRPDTARRHFQDALTLWRHDAAATVEAELYAGGFGRDALIHLCRADLARCEARR